MDSTITLAILRQAIRYVREGNMRRARSLGFTDDELRELRRLSAIDVDALALDSPVICRLSIDHTLLQGIFKRVSSDIDRERTIDKCITLGASVQMMTRFFGLTGNDCSTRRVLLGLTTRQGRVAMPDEETEIQAFHKWQEISLEPTRIDDLPGMMALAEETGLSLNIVWQLVKNWAQTAESMHHNEKHLQLVANRN